VAVKRRAHRPSRKHTVVEAALRLHAVGDPASITVADIASEAGMTAAAVYYHYATKEEILLDGLSVFADAISEEVPALLRNGQLKSPAELPARLLNWMDQHHDAAAVWFTHTDGLGTAVEACRRITNEFLISELLKSVRAHHPDFSLPHASVVAVGLFSALEISANAWLVRDETLVNGREQAFRREVAALGTKILGAPPPVR
jgi:AcrR family transcriptional regulator